MEFRFNLNDIFKSTISKIDSSLLPSDFSGDRKNASQCTALVAEIMDAMGYASAKAQDMQHLITSADKLRNMDHTVYLMIEPDDNDGKGSVVGLLKIGVKNLFLFDETGTVHESKSLCILDFYVHESKQRTGYGKKLYDYMLQDQNIIPCKLAIDKPSENFLSFLYKHYGLAKIHPQNNNFVLFEGFFEEHKTAPTEFPSSYSHHGPLSHIDNSGHNCFDSPTVRSTSYSPHLYGRHMAFKPHDTMGEIVEQGRPNSTQSPTSSGLVFSRMA
uniref:Alpha-tubulin N-acetyltransferase n=1 Tax=Cuerna arida TaxID=1464854 RepID=A0A1B6F6F1_9HEMI